MRDFQERRFGITGALCHILQKRQNVTTSAKICSCLTNAVTLLRARFQRVGTYRTHFIAIFRFYDVIFVWQHIKKLATYIFQKFFFSMYFSNTKTLCF